MPTLPLPIRIWSLLLSCCCFFMLGCSSSNSYRYMEEGLDKVIKQYREVPNFTILLYDMDYQNNKYLHQYEVVTMNADSSLENKTTDWLEVSPTFFKTHQNNLGMEIASKVNGKLTKKVAPAGYSQYVGNPRYGQWRERGGSSFWEFYGKYAMLSTVFNMMSRPARYSYWDTYDRNYRGGGSPYYGPSGYYGTDSYVNNTSRGKQSSWGKKPASFKQKVRNQVSRSTSSSSRRTSRSSSRYSRSSSRSRSSGGFGK